VEVEVEVEEVEEDLLRQLEDPWRMSSATRTTYPRC